jgi:DNA modification methylase
MDTEQPIFEVNKIYQGDVLEVLRTFPDECIHMVVTSPPYWGLRDYGIEGQLGLESTPEEYVSKMVEVFGEIRRVLRSDGTLWLNLGDSYAGNGERQTGRNDEGPITNRNRKGGSVRGGPKIKLKTNTTLKPKDLIGIPWRVALALQADGWYLRSDIVWHKPNAMPDSVKDRPTRAHEYIFLMSKSEKYYYDYEAIMEVIEKTRRNRRSVWNISTQPFPDAHFATFPEKLVEPCILAGTSTKGVCERCGAQYQRVIEKETHSLPVEERKGRVAHNGTPPQQSDWFWQPPQVVDKGWQPSCTCNASTTKAIVLDPFFGSGTTGVVAKKLGRFYVGIELNPEYIKLAEKRLNFTQPALFSA